MGSEQSHELHKNASDAATKIEVCIHLSVCPSVCVRVCVCVYMCMIVYYINEPCV